jgi:hypothetical protein
MKPLDSMTMAELEALMVHAEDELLNLVPLDIKEVFQAYVIRSREIRNRQSIERLERGLKAAGVL